jgi:UDP-N-acetylglucosamine 2-epimerase (non-hydrolysing)
MRILAPVGTRPEIVKMAPVVTELARRHEVRVVATGQHYDPGLTDTFFTEFGLVPDARWRLDGTEAERMGALLAHAVEEVEAGTPDLVLVLGDTHTVPAFCLAARRHQVPVAHLEAGLRSFNATSMEEVNRRVAAATATLHLAPTDLAARFLGDEGVNPAAVRVVGNPVLDALRSMGYPGGRREPGVGVVMTAHRATNVDDPVRLEAIVDLASALHRDHGPVRFPLHPRTRRRLEATGFEGRLEDAGVLVTEPLPYRGMIEAVAGSAVVVTDSGGLQEEAAWLGVPVVVLRSTTPRWEGVEADIAELCGVDGHRAARAVARFADPDEQARVAATPCPYGDGRTGARVLDVLDDPALAPALTIVEPDRPAEAVRS